MQIPYLFEKSLIRTTKDSDVPGMKGRRKKLGCMNSFSSSSSIQYHFSISALC